MQISKKWRKIQPIYRYFGGEECRLDYSEDAALKMFLFETYGKGNLKRNLFSSNSLNGYAVGKHWMDVTIKMWLKDLQEGLLDLHELYTEYPQWHWWLDKMITKPLRNSLRKLK